MTSLSGWLDLRGAAAADGGSRLATRTDAREEQTAVLHAGAALIARTRASVARDVDRGVAAVLTGHPRWLDGALADIALKQGHARALIEAYASMGERLAERLWGTFALAVIDARQSRAVLAIDRMGVERLCYGLQDGLFAFGATVQDVTRHPAFGFEVDPQAIFDYLYHHMIPAPRSIARGVAKLPAATCSPCATAR